MSPGSGKGDGCTDVVGVVRAQRGQQGLFSFAAPLEEGVAYRAAADELNDEPSTDARGPSPGRRFGWPGSGMPSPKQLLWLLDIDVLSEPSHPRPDRP